jgi:hypothetical protein
LVVVWGAQPAVDETKTVPGAHVEEHAVMP